MNKLRPLVADIEVIVPVLNDTSVIETLNHFCAQSISMSMLITVVDNCSSPEISKLLIPFQNRSQVRCIRHEVLVPFEESFVRAARSASARFITFCGAGDLIDANQLETAVATLPETFDGGLIGGRFALTQGEGYRVQNLFPNVSAPEFIEPRAMVNWCLNGPLSGLGGWVVSRHALLQHIDKLGCVSNTCFPQILLGLSISQSFPVIQTPYCWYIQSSELDPLRQKNLIYRNVSWIQRFEDQAIAMRPDEAAQIRSQIGRSIGRNLLSFHVFGGGRILLSATRTASSQRGTVSKLRYFVLAFFIGAIPRRIGLFVIGLIRKVRSGQKWSHVVIRREMSE